MDCQVFADYFVREIVDFSAHRQLSARQACVSADQARVKLEGKFVWVTLWSF